jgi:hypothetical protein
MTPRSVRHMMAPVPFQDAIIAGFVHLFRIKRQI